MAIPFYDRVKETTTTTGTGTLTLLGAATNYQAFSVVGDGKLTYYSIVDDTNNAWEVGIGTYTVSGTTLSRTTVLDSSNSGSLVSFAAGTKSVFIPIPADVASLIGATVTRATTTATPAVLTFNGSAPDATNTFPVASGQVIGASIKVVAKQTNGSGRAVFWRYALVDNTSGTTSLVGSRVISTDVGTNGGLPPAGWAVDIVANNTLDSIDITVTGATSQDITWVGTIEPVVIS